MTTVRDDPASGEERRPRVRVPAGTVAAWVVLALVLLLAASPTHARWQAESTSVVPSVGSGVLDLRVDGALAGAGGTVDLAGAALDPGAVPGESVAVAVSVANAGDAPFAWTATGTSGGALAPWLLVAVHPGGAASNTVAPATGMRQGACTGTATFGPAALTATATDVSGGGRRLDPGTSGSLCLVVALATTAPTSVQGTTGRPTLVLTGRQVAR
ncbi:hypothetical protein KC207_14705 [Phycicoccus sp. BSK3Z-2]|uniref:Uncharacterized protein n=1 Tax=Phycicoccus avicenniae TaxID=2828860 RepID=A0A941DBB9_9MICO|nr:hypothetical protein [Phycicoccus avicenniae]MBR7744543.1 hypothetical protein [Phycicoccus avicenniae]